MSQADDDRAAILNAIITNTRTKIVFGGLSPEDAEFMARVLFTGFLDLQEYKENSLRPTAIGNKKEIVRSRSRAQHETQHEMDAYTRMHSHGSVDGTMDIESEGSGSGAGEGDMSSQLSTPPLSFFGPNAENASMVPMVLSQNAGVSSSRQSFQQSGRSSGRTHAEIETEGEAITQARGTSRGTSITEGESETFVTEYALMGTVMFSLTEQQQRAVGELMRLGLRECVVKVGNQEPVRTRTANLEPAFRSDYFKRVWLPIYRTGMVQRSPYLLPSATVDAQLAARHAPPPPRPEPDFTQPQQSSVPLVDTPVSFATEYWRDKRADSSRAPKSKAKSRPGRKPRGELPPGADRFTVIDSEDGGDNSQ